MDLLDLAAHATWTTGKLAADGHSVIGLQTIAFGGTDTDRNGFVRRQTLLGEDDVSHDALWTHPRWTGRGTIKGFLPAQELPAGAVFAASVGFRKGASATDGVRFSVWAHYESQGGEHWTRVVDLPKRPTGALVEVRADLSWLAGRSCRLELRVDAGKTSSQDWAIWVAPRIETRTGPAARTWRLRPVKLVVERRDPAEDGDDPALVALYFRTSLGHHGSSKVITRTRLLELGTDRGSGSVLAIPASADLTIDDVMVPWSTADLLTTDGVSLAGYVLIGIERDALGDGTVRAQVADTAKALLAAMRTHLEPLTVTAILADPALLSTAVGKVVAAVAGPGGPSVEGGGFDLVGAVGHDLVGTNRVTLFGVDHAAFTALQPLVATSELVLDPGAARDPITPLLPRKLQLGIAGSGSRWTIEVRLEAVDGVIPLPTGI